MWKKLATEQATDENKAHSHSIIDVITNTNSEYVIIIAFP
jgi:hypothetical protein